jgi:hypothetical protein
VDKDDRLAIPLLHDLERHTFDIQTVCHLHTRMVVRSARCCLDSYCSSLTRQDQRGQVSILATAVPLPDVTILLPIE